MKITCKDLYNVFNCYNKNDKSSIFFFQDGYTLKDIRFAWNPSTANTDPVTISNKLEMPDFILTTHNSTVCQRKTSTGN